MFISAAAVLSCLLASPFAAPAPAPTDSTSPRITDTNLAVWVAESLINDVRSLPLSREDWLASRGFVDDLAIAAEVSSRLSAAGLHNLVVSCADGRVNLRGRSDTDNRRQTASRLAAEVTGVTGVDNLLRLPNEAATPSATPSAQTAAAPMREARRAPADPVATEAFDFLTRDGLAGHDLVVSVIDGEVRLNGIVNNEAARFYATAAAQLVPGVRTVVNTLAVRPRNSIQDTGMALLVQRRIENSVTLKPVASSIKVSARDGVLSLEGAVTTEAQRQEAEKLALDTEVVFAVSSFLEVDDSRIVPPAPHLRDFRQWKRY